MNGVSSLGFLNAVAFSSPSPLPHVGRPPFVVLVCLRTRVENREQFYSIQVLLFVMLQSYLRQKIICECALTWWQVICRYGFYNLSTSKLNLINLDLSTMESSFKCPVVGCPRQGLKAHTRKLQHLGQCLIFWIERCRLLFKII
jgi:hypothetical protein